LGLLHYTDQSEFPIWKQSQQSNRGGQNTKFCRRISLFGNVKPLESVDPKACDGDQQ